MPSLATVTAVAMLLSLTLYVLLGGADFGAGVWDLFATGPRAEKQRAVIAKAIGPVWEVNHIWIIVVVVILFTGFPKAFAVLMTEMHVPLSLMLVGIVLRGASFTFRSYDNTPLAARRWNRAFSIPSTVVPILLGSVIGSLTTGRLNAAGVRMFEPWYGLFPLTVGVLALVLFAFLAATYLTLETDDAAAVDDFRRRALVSAIALGAVAWLTYQLAETHAPIVFSRLQERDWGLVIRLATGGFAIAAIVALWRRQYVMARACAALQGALILWGCAAALAPYLVPPDVTIENAAAAGLVQTWLLAALGAGAVVLVPSLVYLFRVFKREALAGRRRSYADSERAC